MLILPFIAGAEACFTKSAGEPISTWTLQVVGKALTNKLNDFTLSHALVLLAVAGILTPASFR
jgi:hypothetical protein